MIRRQLAAVALTATATVMLSIGCSSSTDDVGAGESYATPASPNSQFALAETCSRLFKRHESLRSVDINAGIIRWGCGDVPGVTPPDLGQEYCEYQAVQNGKIITTPSQLTTGKVSCVFTSVFRDAPTALATQLKAALGDPANLGAAAQADKIVKMVGPFNSRGAATRLLEDCTNVHPESAVSPAQQAARLKTTACFEAYAKGGPNAARLKTLCSGNITDAAWTEAQSLGAKILTSAEAGYDEQQDILGCMQVQNAGVPWRNSDPMICSRAARTNADCSCAFNTVPNAINGFDFTGWVDDHIPTDCRLAKVDGQDYPFVLICDASDQEVADLPLNPSYSRSLQNFCKDRFAQNIIVKLPLRALQKDGSCEKTDGFCKTYMSTPDSDPTPPTKEPTTTTPVAGNRTTGAPPAPTPPAP